MKKLEELELDVKHASLKHRVEDCYGVIKVAKDELQRIRKNECDHPIKELADYQWAPSHVSPNTLVCSVCGEVLKQ